MVLRLIPRSLRRSGFFVTVPGVMRSIKPGSRQRRGAKTTRLCRPLPHRSSVDAKTSIASRAYVRDDRDTPLVAGAGWRDSLAMICPSTKVEYFFAGDWTVDSGLIGLEKFGFWRKVSLLSRTRHGRQ